VSTVDVEHSNWFWRAGAAQASGGAVVFDLDGVFSDANHRQALAKGRRWEEFFDACIDDPLLADHAQMLNLLRDDVTVVVLTGRPERLAKVTAEWLDKHGLRWDLLILRNEGDHTAAESFKRRTISELRNVGYELELAFEDDPRNVQMFRQEGVLCVYLHSGYYEGRVDQ